MAFITIEIHCFITFSLYIFQERSPLLRNIKKKNLFPDYCSLLLRYDDYIYDSSSIFELKKCTESLTRIFFRVDRLKRIL